MKRILKKADVVNTKNENTEEVNQDIGPDATKYAMVVDYARNGQVNGLKTLLAAYPDLVHAIDIEGNTLWHLAFKHKQLDVLEFLFDKYNQANPDQKSCEEKLPLEMTSFSYADSAEKIIKKIIELCLRNNDIGAKDKEDNTLLHYAIFINDKDMAIKLLEKDPDLINKMNADLETPIYVAVKHNSYARLEVLLEITNKSLQYEGNILLYTAVQQADAKKITSLLINHGYPVDIPDRDGNTPLHLAASDCPPDIAQLLVEHCKCDTKARNKNGQTPFDLAICAANIDTMAYFLEREISTNRELSPDKELSQFAQIYLSVVNNNLEELKELLPHIKSTEAYLDLLWATAINKKSYEIIKYMLEEHEFDGNETLHDYSDDFPLHIAIKSNDDKLVKLLLEAPDIDPTIIMSEGDTLLHVLMYNLSMKGSEGFIETLLEKGANPDIENNAGFSAISLAISSNNVELFKLLYKHSTHLEKILIEAVELGSTEIFKFLWRENNAGFKKLLPTVWEAAQNSNYKDINKFLSDISLESALTQDDNDLELTGQRGNEGSDFNDLVWISDLQNSLNIT